MAREGGRLNCGGREKVDEEWGVVGSRSKQAIKRAARDTVPHVLQFVWKYERATSPRRRHSDPLAAQSAFPVSYRGSPSLSCGDEPLYPSLSSSLSLSFRASASSWNITAMTNAFLYPVTSILDANGPFHAGPCRYLMYLPWIHAKHGGKLYTIPPSPDLSRRRRCRCRCCCCRCRCSWKSA